MVLRENRIFYLDELRTIAILCVIFAHTIQNFPVNMNYLTSPTLLSYLTVARMGVVLFFMISGALLIGKDYNLSVFLKKRFSRVLIPTIFWQIIGFLSILIFIGFTYDNLTFAVTQFGFPWFVCAILGVYFVIPIFNSFIKEYGIKGAEYFLIGWILLIVLTNMQLIETYYIRYIFKNVGLYIGYAVLGYYLANKEFKIYSLPMVIFCSVLFVITLYLNRYYAFNFVHIFYIESYSIIIQCALLFLIFRYMSKLAKFRPKFPLSKVHSFLENSFIGSFIYYLSIFSFTIYLMHGFIVNYLLQVMPVTHFSMIPQIFLLIAIGSIIVSAILSKIPILNRICGIH